MANALDLFRLDGRVAVVTGGARGLGRAMAEGLAEAGANVAVCGRGRRGNLDEAAEQLSKLGRDCIAIQCDVADEDSVVAMAARVKEHYGQCDILVNNAGISHIKPSTEYDAKAWSRSMDTNLLGPFLCSRELGKAMIERGEGGSIINISSLNGQVGMPIGMAAYATSKVGVIGLTRSLAVEWGPHRIRVNAILPGNMDEGMMEWVKDTESPAYQAAAVPILSRVPLGSFGSADDIKGAVVYLASDASRYVSGEQILLDGAATINGGS
jgi:NAD(P)-dependent dehydrogenase (short-subunit alcohol dehydrogenase family)